jgi:hypothetical protein
MALKADGTVTVGANYPYFANGLLTLGDRPLSNVVAIASGGRHCLALTSDGTVAGWGSDFYGQATGVPSGTSRYTNGIVMLNGQTLSNVVAIAAGSSHSVALKGDGKVVAWGNSSYGQANVPLGLSWVVALAPGGNESANQVIAVNTDGHLTAWAGSGAQTNLPAGLTNVVAAAVGSAHSLALVGAGPRNLHDGLAAAACKTNRFSLALPTQSGRVYSLEFKRSLHDADWTPASLTSGNGHLQTLIHAEATNSSSFYRVRQW